MDKHRFLDAIRYTLEDNPPCEVADTCHLVTYDDIRRCLEHDVHLGRVIPRLQDVFLTVHEGRIRCRHRGQRRCIGATKEPRLLNIHKRYYNVLQLVVSCITGCSMLGPTNRILVTHEGLVIETERDRNMLIQQKQRHIGMQTRNVGIVVLPNGTRIHAPEYTVDQSGRILGPQQRYLTPDVLNKVTIQGQRVRLTHLLVQVFRDMFVYDPEHHTDVDHINGDHTDNRLCNLRPVTHVQNMMVAVKDANPHKNILRDDASHHHTLRFVTHKHMIRMCEEGLVKLYSTKMFHKNGIVYKRQKHGWVPCTLTVIRNGYVTTKIAHKSVYVARIMAQLFIQNFDHTKHVVSFKDHNKHNVNVNNLVLKSL